MDYETVIKSHNGDTKVLLQAGFFKFEWVTFIPHRHRYTEIQIIKNGSCNMQIGDDNYYLRKGDIISIPQRMYHKTNNIDGQFEKLAFQIDYTLQKPYKTFCSFELISEISEKALRLEKGEKINIADYISIILCEFPFWNPVLPKPISDRGYIIEEFFNTNFDRDAKISDLASLLHVCTKQAQRLIIDYTGRNFRENISLQRKKAAEILIKESELTLSEISEKVGYKSYSGLWKALQKDKSNK